MTWPLWPWFTLVHLGSPWFTLVHLGSPWFTLVHLGLLGLVAVGRSMLGETGRAKWLTTFGCGAPGCLRVLEDGPVPWHLFSRSLTLGLCGTLRGTPKENVSKSFVCRPVRFGSRNFLRKRWATNSLQGLQYFGKIVAASRPAGSVYRLRSQDVARDFFRNNIACP